MPEITERTLPIPPWTAYDVVSAFLIADGAAPLILAGLLQTFWPMMESDEIFKYVQFAPIITWILLFRAFGKRFQCSILPYLGLKPVLPLKDYIFYSFIATCGIMAISFLLFFISQFEGIEFTNPYQDVPEDKLIFISFFAVLSAPFIEELVFRGFLQSSLYRYFKPSMAIFLSSLIFTVFHTAYSSVLVAWLNVLLLGALFGYLRHRSGSVIPGMVGHLFNNILASLALLAERG